MSGLWAARVGVPVSVMVPLMAVTLDGLSALLKQRAESWVESRRRAIMDDQDGQGQVDATGLQDTIDAILADLKDPECRSCGRPVSVCRCP